MAFWGAPDTVGPDTALVPGCQVLTYGEYRRIVHEKKDKVLRKLYLMMTNQIIYYFIERDLAKNPDYLRLWAVWVSLQRGHPMRTRPILQNAPPKVHKIDTLEYELFHNPTHSAWNAAVIVYYADTYGRKWFRGTRGRYLTKKLWTSFQ